MTITFENDNNVIDYAIEKIMLYAKVNQHILLAQSIWWISSIIALQQGLVVSINNLQERTSKAMVDTSSEGTKHIHSSRLCNIPASQREREVSATHRVIQEESRTDIGTQHMHPHRTSQVHDTIYNITDLDLDDSVTSHASHFVEQTEQSIRNSRKESKALRK